MLKKRIGLGVFSSLGMEMTILAPFAKSRWALFCGMESRANWPGEALGVSLRRSDSFYLWDCDHDSAQPGDDDFTVTP